MVLLPAADCVLTLDTAAVCVHSPARPPITSVSRPRRSLGKGFTDVAVLHAPEPTDRRLVITSTEAVESWEERLRANSGVRALSTRPDANLHAVVSRTVSSQPRSRHSCFPLCLVLPSSIASHTRGCVFHPRFVCCVLFFSSFTPGCPSTRSDGNLAQQLRPSDSKPNARRRVGFQEASCSRIGRWYLPPRPF